MFGSIVDSVQALSAGELADRLRDLECRSRALAAERAAVIAEAERSGVFREDGHASVRGWLRATVNAPDPTITSWVRTARLTAELPKAGEALASGTVGEAQVGEIARAFANPRCRAEVADVVGSLLTLGELMRFDDFRDKVRSWVRLVDVDGAYREFDQADAARSAWFHQHDGVLSGAVRGGGPAVGEMVEIWQRYCDAEFFTDVALVKAGGVSRSDPQRRFDALVAIFRDAAAAPAGVVGKSPVVNLVISEALFEDLVAEAVTGVRPVREPGELLEFRCETVTGVPVDPRQVLAAALIGHVRRVVVNSASVVIDYGRRSRLFKGAAREAVTLLERRCVWPGCTVPAGRCEIDHTLDWSLLGVTAPRNGGPDCDRHNRWKQRGYRQWRDPDGHWHTYRPDGTEIA